MGIRSYGVMGVDWEERVDFERLRKARLARAQAGLEQSELGALLCFDMSNIRYITATHIGMWAVDKYVRFCLLPQGDDPIMWDFGSAARHHKLFNPWLGEDRSRAGISTLRGSVAGRAEAVAEKIHAELEQRGLLGEPLGVDIVELPVLRALEAAGITVVDGQALMQNTRMVKTPRRDHAPEHGVLDGGRRLRGSVPGAEAGHARERVRRARQPAAVRARLRAHRGHQRDLGRAVQPAPARLHRPRAAAGRPRVLRHPPRVHGLPHLLLPHVRGRERVARPRGRVQALPRHSRQRDLADPARRLDGRGRRGLPAGAGVRLRRRGGCVRAAVRARCRSLELGEADLQPSGLVRLSGDDRRGHGLCARDVLARHRRLAGRADRGAARRDRATAAR